MIDTRIQHCINTLIIAVQLSNLNYLKQYLYEKIHKEKTRKGSPNISILTKGVQYDKKKSEISHLNIIHYVYIFSRVRIKILYSEAEFIPVYVRFTLLTQLKQQSKKNAFQTKQDNV